MLSLEISIPNAVFKASNNPTSLCLPLSSFTASLAIAAEDAVKDDNGCNGFS